MRALSLFILLALSLASSGANANTCSVTLTPPSSGTIGGILRNPTVGTAIISLPVTITCSTAAQVEFSTASASFVSTTNSGYKLTYSVSNSSLTSTSGTYQAPPTGSTFASMGLMPTASVSGNVLIQVVPSVNLQPGTYNETLTLRTDGSAGQTFSFLISGVVPPDCTVTVGTIPNAASVGDILRNPQGRSILVPTTFSCNTYQARVDVSALTGFFKPTSAGNTSRQSYQVSLSAGVLMSNSAVYNSSQIVNSTWQSLGNLSVQAGSANLVITPAAVSNLQADTYTEVIYLRVNAP